VAIHGPSSGQSPCCSAVLGSTPLALHRALTAWSVSDGLPRLHFTIGTAGITLQVRDAAFWMQPLSTCQALVQLATVKYICGRVDIRRRDCSGMAHAASQDQLGGGGTFGMAAELSSIRQGMSLREKVAQITQLDVMEILDYEAAKQGHFKLDDGKLDRYVKAGVGSFLNSPTAGGAIEKLSSPTREQWSSALHHLRQAFRDAGKVRHAPGPLLTKSIIPIRK
jgi:hypothetical protein